METQWGNAEWSHQCAFPPFISNKGENEAGAVVEQSAAGVFFPWSSAHTEDRRETVELLSPTSTGNDFPHSRGLVPLPKKKNNLQEHKVWILCQISRNSREEGGCVCLPVRAATWFLGLILMLLMMIHMLAAVGLNAEILLSCHCDNVRLLLYNNWEHYNDFY